MEILNIDKRKVILTLIMMFVIIPIINLPFEPTYYIKGASGRNAIESIMTFGIYPLYFMHVNKYCYETYSMQPDNERPCKRYIAFPEKGLSLVGFILWLIISYLIVCFGVKYYLKSFKKE